MHRDTARCRELLQRLRTQHPDRLLEGARLRLDHCSSRLAEAMRHRLERDRRRLESRTGLLQAVSPLATLQRGYAIALDADGRTISSITATATGADIAVRLQDGTLDCTVTAATPAPGADPLTRRD